MKSKIVEAVRLSVLVAFLQGLSPILGGATGVLDLVVPSVHFQNVTLEQALSELHRYGLLISLEKSYVGAGRTISIDAEAMSIREILDTLIRPESGYSWRTYTSKVRPGSRLAIINVFPSAMAESSDYIVNMNIDHLEIRQVEPGTFFTRLEYIVPQVAFRRRAAMGNLEGEAGSGVLRVGTPGQSEVWLYLSIANMSLREVLNEVAITSGMSWLYEQASGSWPHVWRQY